MVVAEMIAGMSADPVANSVTHMGGTFMDGTFAPIVRVRASLHATSASGEMMTETACVLVSVIVSASALTTDDHPHLALKNGDIGAVRVHPVLLPLLSPWAGVVSRLTLQKLPRVWLDSSLRESFSLVVSLVFAQMHFFF